MGVGHIFLLTQLMAFILSLIMSFFIFIPMAVNQGDFSGHCLLYATGIWDNASELASVDWGPSSACSFSIFNGIVLMLLSLLYTCLYFMYLARDADSSWLEAFTTAIVTAVLTLMLFSSALTVSIGFSDWCNLITSPASHIVSCELADFIQFSEELGGIDSSNFYIELKLTEFGSWTSFVCLLFLTVTSVIKVIKFRQHETFMTSLNRERQRLLSKVGHRSRSEYAAV